ncbi:MAG TPA: hypothetical protein VFB90_09125 [Dehalococcoidia bacterium]|nr:hypothetical protein [Dehalococcoidia bacterium]
MAPPDPPRVEVTPDGYTPGPEAGQWRVAWRMLNLEEEPLRLLDAHSPHHGFRSELIPLADVVPPGSSARIELAIAHQQRAPSIIDNAFLIVRLARGDEEWRVFYRLAITFGPNGEPENSGVVTGVHPVGFSQTA